MDRSLSLRSIAVGLLLIMAAVSSAAAKPLTAAMIGPFHFSHNGRYLAAYDANSFGFNSVKGQSGSAGLVYDLLTNTTRETLILPGQTHSLSINPSPFLPYLIYPTAPIEAPSMYVSDDGNKVFWCHNLVAVSGLPEYGCFLHNLATQETFPIATTNGTYHAAGMSADGRIVAYFQDIWSEGTYQYPWVVRLNENGSPAETITPIFDVEPGYPLLYLGDFGGGNNRITADGKYFFFETKFVFSANPSGYGTRIYKYDIQANTTTYITWQGRDVEANYLIQAISSDGSYIVVEELQSLANTLRFVNVSAPESPSIICNVNSTGYLVAAPMYHVSVTTDGRYVSFLSSSSELFDFGFADYASGWHYFVFDTVTGQNRIAYPPSVLAAAGSYLIAYGGMSHDGKLFIGFATGDVSLNIWADATQPDLIDPVTLPDCFYDDPAICNLKQHQLGLPKTSEKTIFSVSQDGSTVAFFSASGDPYYAKIGSTVTTYAIKSFDTNIAGSSFDELSSISISADGSIIALAMQNSALCGTTGNALWAFSVSTNTATLYEDTSISCTAVQGPVSITDDGTMIAFLTPEFHFVAWNWVDNTITTINSDSLGTIAPAKVMRGYISGNGKCAVMVAADAEGIFYQNMTALNATRIDLWDGSVYPDGSGEFATVSSDCSFVGFDADKMDTSVIESRYVLYVKDTTDLAANGVPAGEHIAANRLSSTNGITTTADGRFWAYNAAVYNPMKTWPYIVLYDRQTGQSNVISENFVLNYGAVVSADGSTVIFASSSTRMGSFDLNGDPDLYLCRVNTLSCVIVSVTPEYYTNYPVAPVAAPVAAPATASGDAPVATPTAAPVVNMVAPVQAPSDAFAVRASLVFVAALIATVLFFM